MPPGIFFIFRPHLINLGMRPMSGVLFLRTSGACLSDVDIYLPAELLER